MLKGSGGQLMLERTCQSDKLQHPQILIEDTDEVLTIS